MCGVRSPMEQRQGHPHPPGDWRPYSKQALSQGPPCQAAGGFGARSERKPEASCCKSAIPPDDGDRLERRSSDRHRPHSGRNSRASFRPIAPSPEGNGAPTTARASSASPSLFRVPAIGRDGAGSFAAVGRDAGVNTGAPRRIRVLMPGRVRRRTRAWAFLPVGPEPRRTLGRRARIRHHQHATVRSTEEVLGYRRRDAPRLSEQSRPGRSAVVHQVDPEPELLARLIRRGVRGPIAAITPSMRTGTFVALTVPQA